MYRDRDQDHPHGKEMQKSKWLSGEALQIAVKRREAKSKGEKERYKHLNAKFHKISRRDNKAFLSDQRFPGGSDGKASACNAGDLGSIPGLGRSPGEGKATHCSILAWRIPWTV